MSSNKQLNEQDDLAADKAFVKAYLDRVPVLAVPDETSVEKQAEYAKKIKALLKEKNAVLVAHYYTDASLQSLAEETGGCVSDSLEMARFGSQSSAAIIVVAGVKFMGETAKILSPEKTVLMPAVEATCSLDIGCPAKQFSDFCDEHPDYEVVVYANTSAEVKARADWVVTSAIAVDVVEHLIDEGKKVIWAPDKHLGRYIQGALKVSDNDMLLWDGACIVHEEFKTRALLEMKHLYPDAAVLAHPESPLAVLALADVVGSTSQIIRAAVERPESTFIVATDQGIVYKLKQQAPGKEFIMAPTSGAGATCRSCAQCPWMGMNTLKELYRTLSGFSAESEHVQKNEIIVDAELAKKAMIPLQRMLDFKSSS